MYKVKHSIAVFTIAIFVGLLMYDYPIQAQSNNELTSVALWSPADALREVFQKNKNENGRPLRVLVIAGHEPDRGGTAYKKSIERDMNVLVAKDIARVFLNDPAFEIIQARDQENWNPDFLTYQKDHRVEIEEFIAKHKQETERRLNSGELKYENITRHGNADPQTAFLLYSLNAWANDLRADLILQIHFNDTATHNLTTREPSGFAIYIPAKIFDNHEASKEFAWHVVDRLVPFFPASNNRQEKNGVAESEKLIAIGAHNTLQAPTLLIEYGYIYEKPFQNNEIFDLLSMQMAIQTYLGILDFFENDMLSLEVFPLLEQVWEVALPLEPSKVINTDVLALQFLLIQSGVFPPTGETTRSCRWDGVYGSCTEQSVKELQTLLGLASTGIFDEVTRDLVKEVMGYVGQSSQY